MAELSCFKAYDIRGEIGLSIDEDVAYRIGRAVAQHFNAHLVVIGFDARETSLSYASAAAQGAMDFGANVYNIGMAGTEEMYWAVTEFGACAGIEVTASHNPINYNGMKIVKAGSQPLEDATDFQVIKTLAESEDWSTVEQVGCARDVANEARKKYVNCVTSFVDVSQLAPLKVVINSGNGAAGPTLDAIVNSLSSKGAPIEFIFVHHDPDSTFPNGIPNPLIPKNQSATSEAVLREGADIGVAFDGDFDRCFLFDHLGRFIPGEYVVGLLASIFLDKEKGGKIVHDPRVIWNTQDIVKSMGGKAVQSRTGHAYVKQKMRSEKAVYGGEISAHHYFRDFAYCDSGMIPWLLVTELVSKSKWSLAEWVGDRFKAFPSSGERNFRVEDPHSALDRVLSKYRSEALYLDETDGVSLEFLNWRFNLRHSNTEPLVRLNIETRGGAESFATKLEEISRIVGGTEI